MSRRVAHGKSQGSLGSLEFLAGRSRLVLVSGEAFLRRLKPECCLRLGKAPLDVRQLSFDLCLEYT